MSTDCQLHFQPDRFLPIYPFTGRTCPTFGRVAIQNCRHCSNQNAWHCGLTLLLPADATWSIDLTMSISKEIRHSCAWVDVTRSTTLL